MLKHIINILPLNQLVYLCYIAKGKCLAVTKNYFTDGSLISRILCKTFCNLFNKFRIFFSQFFKHWLEVSFILFSFLEDVLKGLLVNGYGNSKILNWHFELFIFSLCFIRIFVLNYFYLLIFIFFNLVSCWVLFIG